MKRFVLALVCALSLGSGAARAEIVALKSGKTIEGKIIEKTGEYVKIDFDGVPLTYFFDEIETVDGVRVGGADSSVQEKTPQARQKRIAPGEAYVNSDFHFRVKTLPGWDLRDNRFEKEGVMILSLNFARPSSESGFNNSFLVTVSMVDAADKPVKKGEEFIAYADEAIDSATHNIANKDFTRETISINGIMVRRAAFGWADPEDQKSYRGSLMFFEPQTAEGKVIVGFALVKSLSQDYDALRPQIEEVFSSIEIGK